MTESQTEYQVTKKRGRPRLHPPGEGRKSYGDTSVKLGDARRAWLLEHGGYQPTIIRLIDEAMAAESADGIIGKLFFVDSEAFMGYVIVDDVLDDDTVLAHSEYSGRQFALRKDELAAEAGSD